MHHLHMTQTQSKVFADGVMEQQQLLVYNLHLTQTQSKVFADGVMEPHKHKQLLVCLCITLTRHRHRGKGKVFHGAETLREESTTTV